MFPWLHDLLSHLTYAVGFKNPAGLGILFVMGLFTDIGIPLLFAVEIFLLYASYYIGPVSLQVLLIVAMLLAGRLCGASILYWLSYFIGEPFIRWLTKYFPWLRKGVTVVNAQLKNRTTTAVTLVRLTPGLLQVPSLVTGSLHLRYASFLLGAVFSSLIYDFSIVFLGYIGHLIIGPNRQRVEDFFLLGFIILIVGFWAAMFIRYRHKPA